MQHPTRNGTLHGILKITNIKLRDINDLTSNQTAKMWDRCRSQEEMMLRGMEGGGGLEHC